MFCSESQWLSAADGCPGGGSDDSPASLLVLSSSGAARPHLLAALDHGHRARLRPGSLPGSIDAVADADLVVIDAVGSTGTGIDTLVRVRRDSGVPVVFVAGAGAGPQAVLALDLGADDVAVEPLQPGELPARIRAVLRRCRRPIRPAPLVFGRLAVHLPEREVRIDAELVETTPLEFDLLARLVLSPRQVFSRVELLQQVWGSSGAWQSPATVTEHVRRLRMKLEPDRGRPRWIRTIRGVGYRFDP